MASGEVQVRFKRDGRDLLVWTGSDPKPARMSLTHFMRKEGLSDEQIEQVFAELEARESHAHSSK